jgi:hypothetical protein
VQYWAFKAALRQIAIDVHLVANAPSGNVRISDNDFFSTRATRHWEDAAWLGENLENRLVLLEKNGAEALLNDLKEQENSVITVFNERAERWVDLGLFALLYDLPGAPLLARRAADCIVGYGWHKDPYVYDVLASIEQIHQAGAAKTLPLLHKVAPVVDKIRTITDGDDVGSSRSKLVDLIAQICPERLPDCYAHHIRVDEWELAEDVLEAHSKLLDFNEGASRALARTFLERREVMTLSELQTQGRSGAGSAFAEQERFLGGIARSREHHRGTNTEDYARGGAPPDIRKFGPSRFKELVEQVSDANLGYEHRDEALTKWLFYWKDRKKGGEALDSIESFFKDTERTFSAEHVLDDAFLVSLAVQGKKAAYKWLVRAHVVRHGWQSYWTSDKEITRRLEWAAKHYKEKWQDFIRDTSKPEPYWERRDYGFSIGLRYLVRFLLLVDQKALAAKYTSTLVDLLTDEVKDQPLPEIAWLR